MYCSSNKTADNDVLGDKKDTLKYDYPTAVIQRNQPVATYETISLHEEDGSDAAHKETEIYTNPVDSKVQNPHTGDPHLQPNPAYINYSETNDHS